MTSFTDEMRSRGFHPASKVLKQDIIKADADIAEKLQVAEGAQVMDSNASAWRTASRWAFKRPTFRWR